ncbi:MAG: hypothetical protein J6X78_13630 [Treponema sp.]|nr:hypothetical protein [Treponema sp.]
MRDIFKKLSLALVLIAAIFMITGCPQEPLDPSKHTVTVQTAFGISFPIYVEDGDSLDSTPEFEKYKNPSMGDYEFDGFYTEDGEKFNTSTPITKDIKLYAKFKKTTTINGDGNTTETTETVSADGNKETTTTTTDKDGNVIGEVKEKEDSEGNTTTTTTTTTTDEDGNTVVDVITTNGDGEVIEEHSDVKPSEDTTVEKLINSGVNACLNFNISQGISFFDAAYKLDPTDDQAKVFSALADLASLSTNGEIAKFLKDYAGIQNYPATMSALINADWLTEGSITYEATDRIDWPRILSEESNKNEDGYTYGTVVRASRVTEPVEGEPIVYLSDNIVNQKKTFNNKEYVFSLNDEQFLQYEDRRDNGEEHNIGYYEENKYRDKKPSWHYYKIDGTGDYYINVFGQYNNRFEFLTYDGKWISNVVNKYNAKIYYLISAEEDYIEYTYNETMHLPVLDSLENENWFKNITKDEAYIAKLMLANVIKGNSKGLDSAVDALYDLLFESKEYKSAIAKIDDVKASVQVPSELIDRFGLLDYYAKGADNSKVLIGKTELNLVKSLLDIYKGVFEYLQSYSFAVDLGAIKKSNVFTMDWDNEDEAMDFVDFLYDNKAKIDPFLTGFLTVKDEKKMKASKATFAGIIGDLIAAYDSVIGTKDSPSIYPSMITDYAADAAVFREGATLLKEAIEKGGIFYFTMGIPKAWPKKAGEGIAFVDFGKVFTPGYFSITNLIETETIKGKKVPVFYYDYWEKGEKIYHAITKVTSVDDFKKIPVITEKHGDEEYKKYQGNVYIHHNLTKLLSDITNAYQFKGAPYIDLYPEDIDLLYNFWYK